MWPPFGLRRSPKPQCFWRIHTGFHIGKSQTTTFDFGLSVHAHRTSLVHIWASEKFGHNFGRRANGPPQLKFSLQFGLRRNYWLTVLHYRLENGDSKGLPKQLFNCNSINVAVPCLRDWWHSPVQIGPNMHILSQIASHFSARHQYCDVCRRRYCAHRSCTCDRSGSCCCCLLQKRNLCRRVVHIGHRNMSFGRMFVVVHIIAMFSHICFYILGLNTKR